MEEFCPLVSLQGLAQQFMIVTLMTFIPVEPQSSQGVLHCCACTDTHTQATKNNRL